MDTKEPIKRPQAVKVYIEDFEIMSVIRPEAAIELLGAMFNYAHKGQEPVFSYPQLAPLWEKRKERIDRDIQDYNDKIAQARAAGKASAEKRAERGQRPFNDRSTTVNQL